MIAAIYSRKSMFTGKGESIENQIELCKEYGNRLGVTDYIIYEDEGFSGSNINRPRFKELLKDVKTKKFNVLICYRLDRISRNVADFSSTLELLQSNNIDFVSIKEQFDTSTPMGRAMVYIASVFAQLERETIAERVRDNMLQLAKTGRWLGGQVPFGYEAEKVTYLDAELKEKSLMKLAPIQNELEIIQLIFNKYLEVHSITKVVKHLALTGVKGKNGGQWASMQVKRILSNPLYVKSSPKIETYLRGLGMNVFGKCNGNGYLTYNKTKNITQDRDITEWVAAIGKHSGVIEDEAWLEVQNILEKNKDKKLPHIGKSASVGLLIGLLRCSKCGSNMKIKQGHPSTSKEGCRYYYYVCSHKDNSYGIKCDNKNIRVDKLDSFILKELTPYNQSLFIRELSNSLNTDSEISFSYNAIESLKATICEKEKAISKLIKQLSLISNDKTEKYILLEIEKLSVEIEKLKESLQSITNPNVFNVYEIDSTKSILDALNKQNGEYDILEELSHKRDLIKTIVNYITWDGENNTFKIQLFE